MYSHRQINRPSRLASNSCIFIKNNELMGIFDPRKQFDLTKKAQGFGISNIIDKYYFTPMMQAYKCQVKLIPSPIQIVSGIKLLETKVQAFSQKKQRYIEENNKKTKPLQNNCAAIEDHTIYNNQQNEILKIKTSMQSYLRDYKIYSNKKLNSINFLSLNQSFITILKDYYQCNLHSQKNDKSANLPHVDTLQRCITTDKDRHDRMLQTLTIQKNILKQQIKELTLQLERSQNESCNKSQMVEILSQKAKKSKLQQNQIKKFEEQLQILKSKCLQKFSTNQRIKTTIDTLGKDSLMVSCSSIYESSKRVNNSILQVNLQQSADIDESQESKTDLRQQIDILENKLNEIQKLEQLPKQNSEKVVSDWRNLMLEMVQKYENEKQILQSSLNMARNEITLYQRELNKANSFRHRLTQNNT